MLEEHWRLKDLHEVRVVPRDFSSFSYFLSPSLSFLSFSIIITAIITLLMMMMMLKSNHLAERRRLWGPQGKRPIMGDSATPLYLHVSRPPSSTNLSLDCRWPGIPWTFEKDCSSTVKCGIYYNISSQKSNFYFKLIF